MIELCNGDLIASHLFCNFQFVFFDGYRRGSRGVKPSVGGHFGNGLVCLVWGLGRWLKEWREEGALCGAFMLGPYIFFFLFPVLPLLFTCWRLTPSPFFSRGSPLVIEFMDFCLLCSLCSHSWVFGIFSLLVIHFHHDTIISHLNFYAFTVMVCISIMIHFWRFCRFNREENSFKGFF